MTKKGTHMHRQTQENIIKHDQSKEENKNMLNIYINNILSSILLNYT